MIAPRSLSLVLIVAALVDPAPFAGPDPAAEWQKLLSADETEVARQLCTGWLASESVLQRTEAHKCLANVELAAASTLRLEGTESGGSMFSGYAGEGVDRAVDHLAKAISLSPEDASIHQGRLHVLLTSARYEQAVEALEHSIKTYGGDDAVDIWIGYSQYFFDVGQLEAGVEFLKAVEAHYPEDHRVIANIGSFLSAAEKDDAALPYLKRAVELEPDDPLNTWNLARLYHFTGDLQNADRLYGRAIELASPGGQLSEFTCVYSFFVHEKLEDSSRACDLQTAHCPAQHRTACGEKQSSPSPLP